MTLWVLSYAEKSKIVVMTIKDRMKQPLSIAELHIKDSYKGPRPHKIRLLTGKNEEFIPPQQFIEILRSANRVMLAEGGNSANEEAFLEMLKGFQLSADRVKICKHCWINKRFNFVNSSTTMSSSVQIVQKKNCFGQSVQQAHNMGKNRLISLSRFSTKQEILTGQSVC
jgi:helicase